MQMSGSPVDCTTTEKLIQAIIQVSHRDPEIVSNYSKLANSMPNRVKVMLKQWFSTRGSRTRWHSQEHFQENLDGS